MKSMLIVGTFVANLIGAVVFVALHHWVLFLICAAFAAGLGYWIFKDSMNVVQHVNRVYWIIRDNGTPGQPHIDFGFMHMTGPPWLRGRGPQVRVGKYTAQVGWCGPYEEMSEEEGLLIAMQGRKMEETPQELRSWIGTQTHKTEA